ncbi:MAG: DEAD/DEAH box helicase [Deltaproteobacteria bacterium]|nr:DEAD/DEAH box helicase [Deltaproteobacteria bacterium]
MTLASSTPSSSSSSGAAFAALGLSAPLVRALCDEGYATPTPIQTRAIPPALAGRDILGCAQTGTGKTAAFVLPLLHHLATGKRTGLVRGLVVTPTRELAAQIGERATAYGKHLQAAGGTPIRHAVIFGGVGQGKQETELSRRPDLLIATPGRMLDLVEQRLLRLDGVVHFVLDEADRMLDMGFIHDVRRILAKLPRERQTLFFSATMAPPIVELASAMVRDPVRVSVTPQATTAETVTHGVYFVERAQKRGQLESILKEEGDGRVIVFTRTKHGANRLAEQLVRSGFMAAAIHGNKSQGARERALGGFREGTLRVLVATDLAARGIDVDGVALVVNYELPNVPESYVHRIGRTGRAGATGRAISLCDREEREFLRDIERLLRERVPVLGEVPASAFPAEVEPARGPRPQGQHGRSGPRGGQGGRGQGGSSGAGRDAGRGGGRHGGGRGGSGGGPRPQGGHRSAEPRASGGASTGGAGSGGASSSSSASSSSASSSSSTTTQGQRRVRSFRPRSR